MSPRFQSGGRTGVRLAFALLGYFVLVTLVITLSPFDFRPGPIHLVTMMVTSDAVANVVLFLPIGFLLRSIGGPGWRGVRAVALATAFSAAIELAQAFIPGRYVSLPDVAANGAGAFAGVVLRDRVERWAVWHPGIVGKVGLDVPLVGLLYLLVPQLWLSGVGIVDDAARSVTTLLLGCAGSIVLVALHRHQWHGGTRLAARIVPPLAFLWFMIGALPALAASPRTFAALAVAVLVVTMALLRRGEDGTERRFETETLRRFFPVFGIYLAVSALWPPLRAFAPWHGSVGFANRLSDAGVVDLLVLLEQVGGFTLVGYAAAEWRGRRELTLAADLPRVTTIAASIAVLLELAQGLLVGPGASLIRATLSIIGTMYGAAVYHLARAHVRALRGTEG